MGRDIYGGEGNDKLYGTIGRDNLYGGDGDDYLYGDAGDDYLEAGEGNDVLDGGEGRDYLYGEGGNDQLYGGNGNDVLDGGSGDDVLDSGNGYDTYIYGKGYGNDTIIRDSYEAIYEDKVILKDLKVEDVRLERNSSDDLIIRVLETNETLTIQGYFEGDYCPIKEICFADAGSINCADIEVIMGTQNADTLNADLNTKLTYIYGQQGDDIIIGGNGNDKLDGGSGDDYLAGGAGNDTYIFGKGYGNDTIDNASSEGIDVDQLMLKGLKLADVRFETTESKDLVIRILATNETLTIAGYFNGGAQALEKICFEDDKVLEFDDVRAEKIFFKGTEDSDNITLDIEDSNIQVLGDRGDDTITIAAAGSYTIYGGMGNDRVQGGGGKDIIYGEEGNDIIEGGSGNDSLNGGAGDDILYGGSGDDYLDGGVGDDTYVFGKGYGNDVIDNFSSGKKDVDQLMLEGLKPGDVKLEKNTKNDLVIRILETNETLTIKGYFNGGARALEKIWFADDNVLIFSGGISNVFFKGTKDSDNIMVDIGDNGIKILGYRGDDTIIATTDGNCTVYGGMGNDMIQSGGGKDTIYGEEGNDIIRGGSGDDYIHGGDGDDQIYGEAGNDILYGCSGNDYLDGGIGNDTYVFQKGFGHDRINNYSLGDRDRDELMLRDLNQEDVECGISGSDLVLTIIETGETMTIEKYFEGSNYALDEINFEDNSSFSYEHMKYMPINAKGTAGDDVIEIGNLNVTIQAYGGAGNDIITASSNTAIPRCNYLYGEEGNDILTGGNGNDTLYGGEGDDILNGVSGNNSLYGGEGNDILNGGTGWDLLEGGNGNDTLYGGKGFDDLRGGIGADTYIFSLGDGDDSIHEYDTDINNIDTIILGDEALNMRFYKNTYKGEYLAIRNVVNSDLIRIYSWDSGKEYQIEQIKSADGMILLNTQVDALIEAMAAFEEEKGMFWDSCVDRYREGARAVISQFWVK